MTRLPNAVKELAYEMVPGWMTWTGVSSGAAISTPFLEIPGNVIATNRREGPVEAWTMGLARGIGMTIVRPGVGVYELVTAPFPMPENYEPILEPEYPWSYFGSGQRGVATR